MKGRLTRRIELSYTVASIGLRRRNPVSTPLKGVDEEGASPLKTQQKGLRTIEKKTVKHTLRMTEKESQKLQQQSALVKKNNEYQAMLGQIADNKRKIGSLEEEVLEKFDKVAELKENAEKIKRANALELRNARAEFEELLAFSKTVKGEIAKAVADRPALTANVRDELLSTYNRLLKGKEGTAPLTKLDNGCCGNCHMKVTMQTANELSKGKIEHCDNCQHLLYADPE